jgi:hypothetical protein
MPDIWTQITGPYYINSVFTEFTVYFVFHYASFNKHYTLSFFHWAWVKASKVLTVWSSDPDTDLPIVLADFFHEFKKQIQSLYHFKLKDFEAILLLHLMKYVHCMGIVSLHHSKLEDFEAIQLLHRLKYVYRKGIFVTSLLQTGGFWSNKITIYWLKYVYWKEFCHFIAPKRRILKQYNPYINLNVVIVSELCHFVALKWLILKQYTIFKETYILSFISSDIMAFTSFSQHLKLNHTTSTDTLKQLILTTSWPLLAISIICPLQHSHNLYMTCLGSLQAHSCL